MRIEVVGLMAASVVSFRGELLREMARQGHEVLAMAPEDDEEARRALADMGVTYRPAPIHRTGLHPVKDAGTVAWLTRTFRRSRADLVFAYGAKPVIYGSVAARLARVPRRVAMITGVGSALGGGSTFGRRVLAAVMRLMYAVALRQTQVVIFQNPDDERMFRSLRLLGSGQRTIVVNGSGVDLERFATAPLPPSPVTFLFIGRFIRDKGVIEYVEAARAVRRTHPEARFQLLGALDSNPSAVTTEQVDAWVAEGIVENLGETEDVRPYLAAAHVCVLPSYGEGMPRSVLEAMAMGRPIITTDVPGCRQTVDDGTNGFLVPVRDADAIAATMVRMLDAGDDRLRTMGAESRRLAEERFDVHEVNRRILDTLGLAAGA